MNLQRLVNECREIKYESDYEKSLLALTGGDFFLADEFVSATEWIVQRNPNAGKPIERDSLVYYMTSQTTAGMPRITVYYTFNERYVYFLDMVHGEHPTNGKP